MLGGHNVLAHLQFGELGELVELDDDWDELTIAEKRERGIPVCVHQRKQGQRMMTEVAKNNKNLLFLSTHVDGGLSSGE